MSLSHYRATARLLLLLSGLPLIVFSQRAPVVNGTGSVYVPLDSWIYPALDRLAALGYIHDHVSNLGPLTRRECARQLVEAEDATASGVISDEIVKMVSELKAELAGEAAGDPLRLESVYTRLTGIGGTPLRDSYHFGQTVQNDFGRPYDSGFNNVTGFSIYGGKGRFFGYFRGEFQSAPGRAADSLDVRQFVSTTDRNPLQGPSEISAIHRFEPLESYVGVRFGFETITFGKQNLWWGPGANSAFSFSSNAQPFFMLRLAQTDPLVLPGFLRHLGKIRTDVMVGKLPGHLWPAGPYINAEKITLDLTDNFELGFSRSAIFGGYGHPLTWRSITSSVFSLNSSGNGSLDAGDRHSGFDFRYRIPYLRRYLSVYSDSFADDDPNPLANPKRSAWAPGIYVSQIPGIRHLDFRFETYSTWLYRQDEGGNFIYFNLDYHDSYTVNGQLLGSWVGRDARAYVASSTYWLSAKTKITGLYRQIKSASLFLPGGGTQTDGRLGVQWSVTPKCLVAATMQIERYNIPLLGSPRHDILSTVQFTFTP